MSPTWTWMMAAICLFALAGMVIAVVKLIS